ncbi:hypothetical protein GCM10009850_067320 [Nonomuraea monospora]|uniref:Uncharacterized protein n=1 Tax=Nonomuraea monospora TaxID=568818 RepID=A0ABN3CPQ6_9ACTN
MTPAQYAQAVRDALSDHPEREELLEDLDDHLAEIAAEAESPLEDRLGPPGVYAEELASAYGERPGGAGKRRVGPRGWILGVHARLMGNGPYRGFTCFLPELRPGWWVLRGYVLAMVPVSMTGEAALVPMTPPAWVVVAAGIWASVWFGRRGRGWVVASAAVAANVVAALALFAGMAEAGRVTAAPESSVASRTSASEAAPESFAVSRTPAPESFAVSRTPAPESGR